MTVDNAGLGVGHIWTEVQCPAYQTLNGADCTCNLPSLTRHNRLARVAYDVAGRSCHVRHRKGTVSPSWRLKPRD